jgi:hypothetical protein
MLYFGLKSKYTSYYLDNLIARSVFDVVDVFAVRWIFLNAKYFY